MSQTYQGDRRKKQEPIDFDDRRNIPFDYPVKKWNPSGKQIAMSVGTAVIIGVLSFIGGSFLNLTNTVNTHTVIIEKILTASPIDQPQIVVNEEIKRDIQLLSNQVSDMVSEFGVFKREQKATDRDMKDDFEEMDDSLEDVNDSLLEIKIKLGIQ
jgi:hypothetical protein